MNQVITRGQIENILAKIQDPHLQQDLVAAKEVRAIDIVDDRQVHLRLELGYPARGWHDILMSEIRKELGTAGITDIDITIDTKIVSHSVQKGVQVLPNIRNTIAVASGKGGVGKSTTAINLALALQKEGASVGILDADIYGPSQPRMLGCRGKPESIDGKTMEPMVSYGLQSMSIGYLIEEDTPMIWRGPMVTSALEQLLRDTNWTDLDYMVIDLPPGTGDIQLTLCQKIPVSGAIIVTTPQDIALLDAKRGLKMFKTVEVPVLGIIENMSTHICSQCGYEEHIFGEGGGLQMAEQYDIDLLGSLPLDIKIREGVDNGKPTVVMDPDSRAAQIYRDIARRAAAKLAVQAKDYTSRFPRIVIDNS
ncbi:MAG: ATPase [Gammaproteobacteria bacterium RBG_16_51_14]|nr:MAG: ATPase [Gammaproteobacteria bacterium RBG_16_51_14]